MIACEKCKERESTVLVIEEPEWPHDPAAGWFKCDECHELDPDGWTYVLDAAEFGDTSKPLPAEPPGGRKGPKLGQPSALSDELIERAYRELYVGGGMSGKEVAQQIIGETAYTSLSACEVGLRRYWKLRGYQMRPRGGSRPKAMAA